MNFLERIKAAASIFKRGSGDQKFNWVPLMDDTGTSVTKPMEQSPWVMAAIKIVAGPISSVPLYFTDKNSDSAIRDSKLETFWSEPGVGLLWQDFVEACIGWLKLEGECFAVWDDVSIPFPEVSNALKPFNIVDPCRMREIVREDELVGWILTDSYGSRYNLLPEQVYQWKYWNPYNKWRGLPEYDAVKTYVETDSLNQKFAKNLAASNGDTGPIISPEGSGLTSEQVKQIVSQLEAKRRAVLRGEFVPAFLNGKIKVEDSKIRSPDASLQAQRVADKEAIFVAFGVPASMTTAVASYSVGSASDRYRLVEDTCKPAAKKLLSGISKITARMTKKELLAELDWSQHSVYKEVMREAMASATALWDRGMPWKQINEFLTMGMQPFKGWETGYVSFGLAPVGEARMPEEDDEYAEPLPEQFPDEEDDNEQQALENARVLVQQRRVRSLLNKRLVASSDASECGCAEGDDIEPARVLRAGGREEEKRKVSLWKTHMASRRKAMKAFESKYRKLVFEARSEVLAKIEGSYDLKSIHGKAAVADLVFNFGQWLKKFVVSMRNIAATTLQAAGDQLYEEIGKDDPWKMPADGAMKYLATRDNQIRGVAEDVFERIRTALEEGLSAGEGKREIMDRVRDAANEISDGRASVIAQTEVGAAYGAGRHQALLDSGIAWKSWLSSRNKVVRPTHQKADEDYWDKPIPVMEPFIVGGYALMHPGDPNGPARECVNCHCIQVAAEAPKQ